MRYTTSRSNRMLGLISSIGIQFACMEFAHSKACRRFGKDTYCPETMAMSYPDRLQLLNWFTLTSGRKYLLLSFVTKSLYKKVM